MDVVYLFPASPYISGLLRNRWLGLGHLLSTDNKHTLIDRNNNLANLLTKKHELSVESVSLNSAWQTGLPWMKLDTGYMPLLVYDQLRVEKPIEDKVRVECYDEAMTGEFSQFQENLLLDQPGCKST